MAAYFVGDLLNTPMSEEIRYILVPGRGRGSDGASLTIAAKIRALEAVHVFNKLNLEQKGGIIITCGYKSPADRAGKNDEFLQGYIGVPEADLLRDVIVAKGIPSDCVRVERDSIDTVTNLAFVERSGFFHNEGTVAIIAQRAHLQRIIQCVAPRILKRPFVGIIAGEATIKDTDSFWAVAFSKLALVGINQDTMSSADKLYKRVNWLWRIVNIIRMNKPYNSSK